MIGMLIGALIPVVNVPATTGMYTGEDVSFGNAFFAALVSGVVSKILIALACAPLESPVMIIAVATLIQLVVTAVAVQFLCSTDLKRVLMIAGTYACIGLALNIVILYVL